MCFRENENCCFNKYRKPAFLAQLCCVSLISFTFCFEFHSISPIFSYKLPLNLYELTTLLMNFEFLKKIPLQSFRTLWYDSAEWFRSLNRFLVSRCIFMHFCPIFKFPKPHVPQKSLQMLSSSGLNKKWTQNLVRLLILFVPS